jgi:hypothetical protein
VFRLVEVLGPEARIQCGTGAVKPRSLPTAAHSGWLPGDVTCNHSFGELLEAHDAASLSPRPTAKPRRAASVETASPRIAGGPQVREHKQGV